MLPSVRSRRRLARWSPLVVLLAATAVLTALQLVPLPSAIVSALSPVGEELRRDGAELAGVSPWRSLSLDPASTLRGLTFLTIVLGIAVVAIRVSSTQRGRYLAIAGVTATCGLTAAITGLHALVGATRVYGLYAPAQATPTMLGPLLNPNHLGCLMAVGTILGVALVVYPRQSSLIRACWLACTLACGAVLFATTSRGAVVALSFGLGLTLVVLAAQRFAPNVEQSDSAHQRFLMRSLPIGIVVVCSAFVVIYTSGSHVVGQLESTSVTELGDPRSKFAAWQSATHLLEESPWVGVGRGAIEPTITRVHPASAFVSLSHLENEYVQGIVEYGIPGALVLGAVFVWLALASIRAWRDGPLAAGALGVFAAVGVQSVVDFGVQLLGVAIPATIVLATLDRTPLVETSRTGLRRTFALRVALTALLVGAAIIIQIPQARALADDHEELATRPSIEDIREIIERHPLDYYGYAAAAENLSRRSDPRAVRFLNHALRLHPTHFGLHRMAARMLLRIGRRQQAALEYSIAMKCTTVPEPLLREITRALEPAEVATAIPTEYENTGAVAIALTNLGHQDALVMWLVRVVEERPRDLRAAELLYDTAWAIGDLPRAEQAARRRLELTSSLTARLALATVLSKQARDHDIVQLLADISQWRNQGRTDQVISVWYMLCDAHTHLKAYGEAMRCLHLLEGAGLVGETARSEILKRLERLQLERRNERP